MRTFRIALCALLVPCTTPSRPTTEGSSASSGADGGTDAAATPRPEMTRIYVTVGSTVFAATLSDTPAARAFAAMLPLTLNMADVNANEKYVELDTRLPANASSPGTIQAGDVMLYGSNGLVLFYETFSTSYSYTHIGKIDDASGLVAALGAGNAIVTFAP